VLDTPQVQAYLPVRGKGPLKILYLTRVLFAADGSELAIEAARRAAGMLADFEATVLGVVSPLLLAPGTAGAGIDSVALPVTSAERRVVHGDPAIEICRVAEEGRFDLVVIGSHGSGFLKRVLLGSVSHHVLHHHASCPVLVVRERDDG
jgi:nucleotide-binding universal stress UspA family protein